MGALTHDLLPSSGQINGQFKPGPNMSKTLAAFKRLYRNGRYTFGALTAEYNGWAPGSKQYDDWLKDLKPYHEGPIPTAADQIVECISGALNAEDPLPVQLFWGSPTGRKEVTCSFDSTNNTYIINIIGYPVPRAAAEKES
jgi:hypothetical protein